VHVGGSGVTAGLSGSRVFAPSWSGWIEDASRPVAKGG
jgi:thiosulfate/3-mercaptopyruvate sulfurtransferase